MTLPVARLRTAAVFQPFAAEALREVASRLDGASFAPGEVFRARQDGDRALWVLLEGQARVIRPSDEGPLDLGTVEAGGVVGHVGVVLELPDPTQVVAVRHCLCAELTRASYTAWLAEGSPTALVFQRILLRSMARQLRLASQRVAELAARPELAEVARERGLLSG